MWRIGNLGVLAFALSLPIAGAGCSGGGGGDDDDDDGGFSDDGGEGTGTLRILASLSVGPDGIFDATVNLADADEGLTVVSGATVVLETPTQGEIELLEEPVGFGTYVLPSGAWDYEAGFGLRVDAGAEGNATGIGFDAPDLTDVTSPENQDTYPINTDMAVTWAGRGADEHRIELTVNDYDTGWVAGDDGEETIPAMVLGTATTETLTIRRRKEIEITAGSQNSAFSAELEDVVEPIGLQ